MPLAVSTPTSPSWKLLAPLLLLLSFVPVAAGVARLWMVGAGAEVTPENVRKEYFGVCITSVLINGIVSAEVSAWGMRRTDSGPYLRLSVIDHDGRSFDFSAPKEKAEDLFRSIVASVRAKEPNQLLRTSQ